MPTDNDAAQTQTLEQAWDAYGLTPALLARARNAGIADTYLKRMLAWNAPPKRFEEEVDWAERLLHGAMRARQLTPADAEAFRSLWANSPRPSATSTSPSSAAPTPSPSSSSRTAPSSTASSMAQP